MCLRLAQSRYSITKDLGSDLSRARGFKCAEKEVRPTGRESMEMLYARFGVSEGQRVCLRVGDYENDRQAIRRKKDNETQIVDYGYFAGHGGNGGE